jgi:hypothetical protein
MAFAPYGVWPQPFGSKKMGVIVHAGPASYTQVTTGPLAGGDLTVGPEDFGLSTIEAIDAGITSDGLFRVEPVMPVTGPVTRGNKITLRWTVVATGAQVAALFNLSGSSVNIQAFGL